jgi:glycosyltransferase involved in cell wall biosynthesis
VVHSEHDRDALRKTYPVGTRPCAVAVLGPFSHYRVADAEPLRDAPPEACNILFFGTIRPYKGLEDLVRAFELLAAEDPDCWLTVVGETWEGWTEPLALIAASPLRERITLVNEYVSDADAARWFAGADVVALPYRRSSASGPLHMTTDAGLPVVVTDVGGLAQACAAYDGAVLVPPADPEALRDGLREAIALRGQRFEDPGGWEQTAATVLGLAGALAPAPRTPAAAGV